MHLYKWKAFLTEIFGVPLKGSKMVFLPSSRVADTHQKSMLKQTQTFQGGPTIY